jgi:hypothetical protein
MTRILIALFALGLFAATSSAGEDTKIPKNTCVQPCKDCAKECEAMAKHARDSKQEGLAVVADTCHHMCHTCALAVEHKNFLAWATCELCERYCNQCATECDKANTADAKKCAETCRKCATACADARK